MEGLRAPRSAIWCLTSFVLFAGLPVTADDTLEPSQVGWSAIQVKATKFFLSVTTGISITDINDLSLQEILLEPGQGNPISPGHSNRELIIGINGLGRHHETRLYLISATGAAVQRISHDSGSRLRHRIYRFTDIGAYQRTWWPVGAEEERLPPDRWPEWSERSKGLRPYTVNPAGSIVTEPAGLLYIIGAAPLYEPGDAYEIMAYMRGHVFPVRVEVVSRENINVNFADHKESGLVQLKGKRPAIKLVIAGSPDGRGDDPEDDDGDGKNRFELLGMRGDITMHIDPDTRAPLQLQGKVKILGKVTMRIQSLTHRPTKT
jgi:hypothetical protein